ncbi:37S ribosomal protein S9, mitochondrial [Coemansia erecta]|uniref:37S ribosomal protein S9, mitochondrial n=1 Tax=Coemansia erecta TaxID=147472 RepID=A0A9W7XW80_9FUNG|nr:37S ribosomal protein S9, mitochondrial [Coemansia erecta]
MQLQNSSQSKLDSKQPSPFDHIGIRPVKRPDTAAYFMANPKYADLLSAITSIAQQHRRPEYSRTQVKRGRWIARKTFESQHSIKMNGNEYAMLTRQLNEADSVYIRDKLERETVGKYLNQFRRGYSHVEVVGMDGVKKEGMDEAGSKKKRIKERPNTSWKRGMMDSKGRWRAAGKRKEAIACAWLVPVEQDADQAARVKQPTKITESVDAATTTTPAADAASSSADTPSAAASASTAPVADDVAAAENTDALPTESTDLDSMDVPTPRFTTMGQVLVNGRPLPEYFIRSTDRESVLFPFTVANKNGRYNVFIRVRGGGHTGQAEACQLAVARALYAANRKAHAAVRAAGLLFTDGRRVERKKTGKPKARKSYTWVKR